MCFNFLFSTNSSRHSDFGMFRLIFILFCFLFVSFIFSTGDGNIKYAYCVCIRESKRSARKQNAAMEKLCRYISGTGSYSIESVLIASLIDQFPKKREMPLPLPPIFFSSQKSNENHVVYSEIFHNLHINVSVFRLLMFCSIIIDNMNRLGFIYRVKHSEIKGNTILLHGVQQKRTRNI